MYYVSFRSPPRMLNSCLLTSSDFGSKQFSLSPVSTPSKVVTDSNYGVGSLSELEGFHVLDIKAECNEDTEMKCVISSEYNYWLNKIETLNLLFICLDHFQK